MSYDGTTFATGKTLTMTLNLQFTSSFPGTNFIDEYVWDTQFGIADWGQIGTVTVGAPPIITTLPGDLGFGIALQTYSVTLNAKGRQPFTWSVTSGTLPPGISLSAAGVLNGQQPQAATTSFTIGVRDAVGISAVTPLSGNLQIFSQSDITTSSGSSATTPGLYMPATRVGVFRNNLNEPHKFWEDSNGNGAVDSGVDRSITGFTGPGGLVAGDIPVVGDWTGDGNVKAGIYRASTGQWFLDMNNNGTWDDAGLMFGGAPYGFGGIAGDVPVVGDWQGRGKDCIGIFRSGFFWILDLNCNGSFDDTPTDAAFPFGGNPKDVPVVGRWTGPEWVLCAATI